MALDHDSTTRRQQVSSPAARRPVVDQTERGTADVDLHMLDARPDFAPRHIGPSEAEQQAMLAALGYESRDALIAAAMPDSIRSAKPLELPPPLSEAAARNELIRLASLNTPRVSMIG